VDNEGGMGEVQRLYTFDYEKKLRHCVEPPRRAETDPSMRNNLIREEA